MTDEKTQLKDLYNDYKTRCLFLGEEYKDLRVDEFSYRVDDKNNLLLTDWHDYDTYTSTKIKLPDYFDGIENITPEHYISEFIVGDSLKFICHDALKFNRFRYIDIRNVEILENASLSFSHIKELRADKLKYIAVHALSYVDGLKELCLPSVELCEDLAFYSSRELEKVEFKNLLLFYSNTFTHCDSLKYLNLGGKVRVIPENAFSYSNLETINGLSSVIKIKPDAFKYTKINKIDLLMCESIAMNVFSGTPLKEISLSDNLIRIGDSAFSTSNNFYTRLKVNYYGSKNHFLNNITIGYDNNDFKKAKVKYV